MGIEDALGHVEKSGVPKTKTPLLMRLQKGLGATKFGLGWGGRRCCFQGITMTCDIGILLHKGIEHHVVLHRNRLDE